MPSHQSLCSRAHQSRARACAPSLHAAQAAGSPLRSVLRLRAPRASGAQVTRPIHAPLARRALGCAAHGSCPTTMRHARFHASPSLLTHTRAHCVQSRARSRMLRPCTCIRLESASIAQQPRPLLSTSPSPCGTPACVHTSPPICTCPHASSARAVHPRERYTSLHDCLPSSAC